VQSLGARFAQGEITLEYAQEMGCKTCATPGGGCQFLGTAATSQVVSEALGLSIPHSALAPSGQAIWTEMARSSARALIRLEEQKLTVKSLLTEAAINNAMVVHAAFGGSTNLLLHIPAIAFAAQLQRPVVEDWIDINRCTPRLVDVLPNGPAGHPTVRVFLAGGVPEVMLHLRELGLLDEAVLTASGDRLDTTLDWWQKSERRKRVRAVLEQQDRIDPDDVIMNPQQAEKAGLTSTVTFPKGNIAPEGAVIKSTAIDPTVLDEDAVYRKTARARVFTRERLAIEAIKNGRIQSGDVIILICAGPMGSGMEETYQLTAALKYLSWGKHVAIITDARFSGVSTGACIGHVGPEALQGGPIGKLQDGDVMQIVIDTKRLHGSIDLIGAVSSDKAEYGVAHGDKILSQRKSRPDLTARSNLPDDTRLWAALQSCGGGTWGGCVYDTEAIIAALQTDLPKK
jgi:putative YjhG/YagF family dehydratase